MRHFADYHGGHDPQRRFHRLPRPLLTISGCWRPFTPEGLLSLAAGKREGPHSALQSDVLIIQQLVVKWPVEGLVVVQLEPLGLARIGDCGRGTGDPLKCPIGCAHRSPQPLRPSVQ